MHEHTQVHAVECRDCGEQIRATAGRCPLCFGYQRDGARMWQRLKGVLPILTLIVASAGLFLPVRTDAKFVAYPTTYGGLLDAQESPIQHSINEHGYSHYIPDMDAEYSMRLNVRATNLGDNPGTIEWVEAVFAIDEPFEGYIAAKLEYRLPHEVEGQVQASPTLRTGEAHEFEFRLARAIVHDQRFCSIPAPDERGEKRDGECSATLFYRESGGRLRRHSLGNITCEVFWDALGRLGVDACPLDSSGEVEVGAVETQPAPPAAP